MQQPRKDDIVKSVDMEVLFGPVPADRSTLSNSCLATIDALYRHPIAHNLEWSDVVALFTSLGSVQQKSHNEMSFELGGEHRLVHKPHAKDLTSDDVMVLRHLLTRTGWSLHPAAAPETRPDRPAATPAPDGDLLVAVEHHEARLYHLAARAADAVDDTIRPYDPHRFLHHLSHKDQPRERGQRAAEDPAFYERIAQAIVSARQVVVIGHGEGHSNAAHHLLAYLKLHHPETLQKVTCEVVADLSRLTPPQLLVLGRRALSFRAMSGRAE